MILRLLLSSMAILLLAAWPALAASKLNVFACEPEWRALAQELGGDRLSITSATTAKQDPHYIQAKPSLIASARRADLLVCTGAELEVGWLPVLLRKSGNGNILAGQPGHFMATDHVELLEKPDKLDRSLGDVHAAGNPHIHLDPNRLIQVAKALSLTLKTIDPANSDNYQQRLVDFLQRWETAMEQWRRYQMKLRDKRYVVHHSSWVYLAKWLGMERAGTLEPKPGIPASSGHLANLVETMRTQPADVILYAGFQDDRAANWLADKTGIPATALPFSPGKQEGLIDWYQRLLDTLHKTMQ